MAKRDVSPKMQAIYDARKEETLHKVQIAINQLKESGEKVTKKRLAEVSGLSSGTFSKNHVKELLKENKVCQYAPGAKQRTNFYVSVHPNPKTFADEDKEKIIIEQQNTIKKLRIKNDNLAKQFHDLEKNYERTLGQYELAAQILDNMGVKIRPSDDG